MINLLVQEMGIRSLGPRDPLEKEMAAHSSILARRIPCTEEPGRLQSIGVERVRHNSAAKQQQQRSTIKGMRRINTPRSGETH